MTQSRLHCFYPRRSHLNERFEALETPHQLVVLETEEELVAALNEIEALLALRPPRGHWQRAKRLQLVQMFGVGVDSLLPAPDLPERVRVCNAAGMASPYLAEFALSLLLALYKRLPLAFEQQQADTWRRWVPKTLAGSTVVILGFGAIGHHLASLLVPLGVRVLATRQQPASFPGVERVSSPSETDSLLAEADAVVVLLPRTEETQGLINREFLEAIKPGAFLIHLSRGGVVDEPALIEALTSGHLAAAAVDVFEDEPLPSDHPLWRCPNLTITPHTAGSYPRYLDDLLELFVANVQRIRDGSALLNEVPIDRGY